MSSQQTIETELLGIGQEIGRVADAIHHLARAVEDAFGDTDRNGPVSFELNQIGNKIAAALNHD